MAVPVIAAQQTSAEARRFFSAVLHGLGQPVLKTKTVRFGTKVTARDTQLPLFARQTSGKGKARVTVDTMTVPVWMGIVGAGVAVAKSPQARMFVTTYIHRGEQDLMHGAQVVVAGLAKAVMGEVTAPLTSAAAEATSAAKGAASAAMGAAASFNQAVSGFKGGVLKEKLKTVKP
ncbi:MAG: hypothetical protein ACYDDA_13275 [Acidiferrobacteraceae bacterium]